jgi:hypothetical protein
MPTKKPLSENPLPWFRLYGEIMDDDKLRLLAFEDRWHFIALLCCKSKGILDTSGDLLPRRVAIRLGLSPLELEQVARRLEEVGLIDAATFQPIAWGKRQCRSDADPTNSSRQRAFRERQSVSNALRNAKVTPLEEEEEEEKREKIVAKKPRQTAARIPSDWTPSDGNIEYCRKERPELNPLSVAENFKDYWLANATDKARKLDWDAAWRTWVRAQRVFENQKPATPAYRSRNSV